MKTIYYVLKDDGQFLLQTMGENISVTATDPWTSKYIFPNSMLPSVKQVAESVEGLFMVEDWHSFGSYYDKTLMVWFSNFELAWNELKSDYDERF